MKTVDIVVPCFNEEEVLPEFVRVTNEVIATLPQYSFRYILVNDGSRDKTLLVMMKLAEQYDNVKYISFSRNFGKESAMYAGLEHTTADYVIVMDADLQHPPMMFPQMLAEIEKGHDCCALYREEKERKDGFLRTAFSNLFFNLQNSMTDVKMPKGAVDYRVMSRQMIDSILSLSEVQRFSKGIFCWVGFDTKWIPYENVERTIGTSSWNFLGLFRYAIDGIVCFSVSPLRWLIIIGILMLVAAFGLGVAMIFMAIFASVGVFVPVLCAVMAVGGILELSMGILGEYIGRTYMEVKDRPIYIAKVKNIEKADR